MTSFFKKRKVRKQTKEYLNAARHARNMREDIADPADLAALREAEADLREIRKSGAGDLEAACETLEKAVDKIYPASNRTGWRENVEVIIVAIGAAMAIRAFFLQPYKIPTGSMQPTLNGITLEAQSEATFMDRAPLKLVKWLFTGASYKELKAKAGGTITNAEQRGDHFYLTIGGVEHKMPEYMFRAWLGDGDPQIAWKNKLTEHHQYQKGEVIYGCRAIAGDHILVNKIKYNFMSPDRGEIAVFDTRSLAGVRDGSFYIKRLVGLPGEKIQIKDDHYLMADGVVIEDPPVFKKINEDPNYAGHTFEGNLISNEAFILLADNEYMMMGDNTRNSQDGRFFTRNGKPCGVPHADFQGPAMFVYWPFREHWGRVE